MLHTVSVQLPALVPSDIKKQKKEREKQNAIDVLPTPVRWKITLVIVLVVGRGVPILKLLCHKYSIDCVTRTSYFVQIHDDQFVSYMFLVVRRVRTYMT